MQSAIRDAGGTVTASTLSLGCFIGKHATVFGSGLVSVTEGVAGNRRECQSVDMQTRMRIVQKVMQITTVVK